MQNVAHHHVELVLRGGGARHEKRGLQEHCHARTARRAQYRCEARSEGGGALVVSSMQERGMDQKNEKNERRQLGVGMVLGSASCQVYLDVDPSTRVTRVCYIPLVPIAHGKAHSAPLLAAFEQELTNHARPVPE